MSSNNELAYKIKINNKLKDVEKKDNGIIIKKKYNSNYTKYLKRIGKIGFIIRNKNLF
jgi:uncharacterized protein YwgA